MLLDFEQHFYIIYLWNRHNFELFLETQELERVLLLAVREGSEGFLMA